MAEKDTKVKLDGYSDRFDPAKQYDAVLVRSGRAGQASEHNEMQSILSHRVKSTFDVLFRDGDIVEGCQVITRREAILCQAGKIYCDGTVRDVAEAVLSVPMSGICYVGVYRQMSTVTELDDPSLYNQEIGSPAQGQPGAARRRVVLVWGWRTDAANDGQNGDFYPVHTLDSGIVRIKETPPALDSTSRAIARYDMDSAGPGYVVEGMDVRQESDLIGGEQCYTVSEGRARVSGNAIDLPTSRRIPYPAQPDLLIIESEPHAATGEAGQRIVLDRTPIESVQKVRVLLEKSATLVHGPFSGCEDLLPETAVLRILSVTQGGVTFTQGTDYFLSAGRINWNPTGADTQEPATGSSYQVTYQHNRMVHPDAMDETSITVSGAVAHSEIEVSYTARLPRIDRLCLTADGAFEFVKGVASDRNPIAPQVPRAMLGLASIHQTWDSRRVTTSDAVSTVAMNELVTMRNNIWNLKGDVARLTLVSDVNTRENAKKYGIFTDSFADDLQRDQGVSQTAAIVSGELTLPVSDVDVKPLTTMRSRVTLPYTLEPCLSQLLRTGSRLVNPYAAFDPVPAIVALDPAVDRWTETQTQWTSSITNRVTTGSGSATRTSTGNRTETVSSVTQALEFLREITVNYVLDGFAPAEKLARLVFDGLELAVPPTDKADARGVYRGRFVIPAGVRAGAKSVMFIGSGGSRGDAVFVGQGTLTVNTLRQVTTITTQRYDPLGQTFMLEVDTPLAAVDLWFTVKGSRSVTVQIRDTIAGVPAQGVLASKRLELAQIFADGVTATRTEFDAPVNLAAGTEYAIVILTDDNSTALAVAEVGKSTPDGQWVTQQPYTIGVLHSSSNASSWTAHQMEDLTFRLLRAVYNPAPFTVELGTATLSGVTDALFLGLVDRPAAAARAEFSLSYLDDAGQSQKVSLSEEQPLRFNSPVNGPVSVAAKLTGTASTSPILYDGAQLVAGRAQIAADYVSRVIPAGDAATTVKVFAQVFLPAGAVVTVSLTDGAVLATDGLWQEMSAPVSRPVGDGWMEMEWTQADWGKQTVRCRIVLTGNAAARPSVRDLRLMAMD